MTKKEKFNVAVAAFEELLGKHQLWEEYLTTFNLRRLGGTSQDIYADWKEWASSTPKYQWCQSAFIWEHTPLGHETWRNFNYNWLTWICENLNF